MKKILILLICIFTLGVVNVNAFELPEETNNGLVSIYIFRGSGCSHCYEALEYFYNIFEENPELTNYIDVYAFETWYDDANTTLAENVAAAMGDELSGVPYFVIGNAYSTAGFTTSTGEELINEALRQYTDDNYVDYVYNVYSDQEDSGVMESLDEALIAEGIIDETDIYYDDDDYEDYIEEYCQDYCDCDDDETDDSDVIFEADEEGFFALGVATVLLFILVILNFITLPLSIVFIILFIKEKHKNKSNN